MRNYPEELTKVIPEFPEYLVSSIGQFFNRRTGRQLIVSPSTTNYGGSVGFVKNGKQYRRSAKLIVAKAFVPGRTVLFNTPIQLDGDVLNLDCLNLEWRPRWFAWEYTHQFRTPHRWYYNGPILDVVNNVEYETIYQAAVSTGSLCKDIYSAMRSNDNVFPGRERYVYV